MANHKAPESDQMVTSIRVPRDLWQRFQAAAALEHRTAAGELRFLIEQRVDQAEALEQAA